MNPTAGLLIWPIVQLLGIGLIDFLVIRLL
jgi:hypothetical protein